MTHYTLFKVHNLPHNLPTRDLKAVLENAVAEEVVWLSDAFHMDGKNGYNVLVKVINPSCSDRLCSALMRDALKRHLANYSGPVSTRKGIEVSSKPNYTSDPADDAKRCASFVVMIHVVDTCNNFTANARSRTANFIEQSCGVRVARWGTDTRRRRDKPFCVNIAYLEFASPREADCFLAAHVFDATPVLNRPQLLLHCVQKHYKLHMYSPRKVPSPSESSVDTQSTTSHESHADVPQLPLFLTPDMWRHNPY